MNDGKTYKVSFKERIATFDGGVADGRDVFYISEIESIEDEGFAYRLLMTDDERKAMEGAGAVAVMAKHETSYKGDWPELCDKIHQIQHTLMAQVCSRMLPHRFRPYGGLQKGI
jgi:midasin (ATPase involved in ribosome maturation)